MKLNKITILALFILMLAASNQVFAQSQIVNTDSISNSEAETKQKQADQLTLLCPHYPTAPTGHGGMNASFDIVFKNWTNEYPNEYEQYKKIFNYSK